MHDCMMMPSENKIDFQTAWFICFWNKAYAKAFFVFRINFT